MMPTTNASGRTTWGQGRDRKTQVDDHSERTSKTSLSEHRMY